MSHFLMMSHVIVMEGHLLHKEIFVERVTKGMNVMNVLERVYVLYALMIRR